MNKADIAVLELVKSAVTQKKAEMLQGVDWSEIVKISRQHQIGSLVYCGIRNSGIELDERTRNEFLRRTYLDAVVDQRQMDAICEIQEAFKENNVDYLMLKGSILKDLYPGREMRVMGDIDILIRVEQYEKTSGIMRALGYREGKETDHELHWEKDSPIHIELHKKLIPSYNTKFYAYFENAWDRSKLSADGDHFEFSNEDHLLLLVTHFAKHYRDGGIGVRHLLDIWLFVNKKPGLNHAYIRTELEKIQLLEFYDNILKTAKYWFGEGEVEITPVVTLMIDRIMAGGSFGTAERCDIARATRLATESGGVPLARRTYITRLIFLPLESMQKKYPVLNKIPVLLPVFWVVRWGEAVLFKRDNIVREKKRISKIEAEAVDNYDAELRAVGLSF